MIEFKLTDEMLDFMRNEGMLIKPSDVNEFIKRGYIIPTGEFLINPLNNKQRNKTHMTTSSDVYKKLYKAGLIKTELNKHSYSYYKYIVDQCESIGLLYKNLSWIEDIKENNNFNIKSAPVVQSIKIINELEKDKALKFDIDGQDSKGVKYRDYITDDDKFSVDKFVEILILVINNQIKGLLYTSRDSIEEFNEYWSSYDSSDQPDINEEKKYWENKIIETIQLVNDSARQGQVYPEKWFKQDIKTLFNIIENIALGHIALDKSFFLDNCNSIRINGCNENYILLPKDQINDNQLYSLKQWVKSFFNKGKDRLLVQYFNQQPYTGDIVCIYTKDDFNRDNSNLKNLAHKIEAWYNGVTVEHKPSNDSHYRSDLGFENINVTKNPTNIYDFLEEQLRKKKKKNKKIINDDIIDDSLRNLL